MYTGGMVIVGLGDSLICVLEQLESTASDEPIVNYVLVKPDHAQRLLLGERPCHQMGYRGLHI